MPKFPTVIATAALAMLAFASQAAFAQSGDRAGDEQTPPPPHLKSPPAPALSAEDAVKTFRVPPGFRVEIVAADPLVFDPVAMSFDAEGRIWVVEMRAFMPNVDGEGEDAPIGTVAVLEDTDRDGRMDRRTEFAGGFVLPRAVAPVAGGVLVAEPPNLWFLQDTNGDDKADKRTKVADDYGSPANPEHSANGLMWALDNWIYSANHTVRYRYDRGKWLSEPTIFRGQWGITQDDYGRLLYNTNSDPLRMDVLPAESLRRNPNLVEPNGINVQLASAQELPVWPGRVTIGINRGYRMLREDGTLPVVTAACGPVVYRGSLFPPSFHGNAFIAEPAGNLIKRVIVEERSGVPSARNAYAQTEFMTSTDERFRPVNLYNGPDGALYVVDMYRGVIQHRIFLTTYLRNQIKERGLEAPLGMGRIYRIVPEGARSTIGPASGKSMFAKATTGQLVAALANEEAWVRDTAQRLLVERHDVDAIPMARKLVRTSPAALGRLHALWTLEGLNAVDWESIQRGLEDVDVHVAAAAARLAERFLDNEPARSFKALSARAAWGELAFQRQVALAVGSAPSASADALLAKLATQSGAQPYLADAIVSSLAGRESAFFEHMIANPATTERPENWRPVMSTLSAAILKAGDAQQIERLFAHLAAPSDPRWLQEAIWDGVERFIPGEGERQRTAFLPAAPTSLLALSQGNDDSAARAREALRYLRWHGQQIDPGKALASLTDEQRQRYERGRREFAVCAACHQADGQGMEGLAPPLVGSRWATGGPDALIRIVLNGRTSGEDSTMPPLRSLDDETIAAILTYIRRSWGHESDPISPDQVHVARGQTEDREEPWTDAELEPMN
jgi:glucose/arabinose dehydrogenase/mono/diheme cytochrome c family protein